MAAMRPVHVTVKLEVMGKTYEVGSVEMQMSLQAVPRADMSAVDVTIDQFDSSEAARRIMKGLKKFEKCLAKP